MTYRDALDQETISFYDELGRLVSTTYPDGTMELSMITHMEPIRRRRNGATRSPP